MAKATDILWDIDSEDIYAALDKMDVYKAAEVLGISTVRYALMTTEERHQAADNLSRFDKEELMNLPSEVDIPDRIDEEEVSDWLSDEFGFCHQGFKLS